MVQNANQFYSFDAERHTGDIQILVAAQRAGLSVSKPNLGIFILF